MKGERSGSAFPAWAPLALLIGLTAFAYLPSLANGFIWDDDVSLTQNPFIRSGEGLHDFWVTTLTPDYWPVTATTLWAEWRLWGMNPLGYHVTNLGLHLAEVLLLWTILRRLQVPGATLAALLFALHPVNVESVAWITQRKNLMAMLFYLLSVLAFLRAGERFRPAYWLSLLAFALGMLAKGSVAVLPVVLLGIIAWRRPLRAGDFLRVAPFFAVAGALTLVNIWFQGHHLAAAETIRHAGGLERLLGAGAVVWFYLSKALLPIRLILPYPQWRIDSASVGWWLPLLATVAMTCSIDRMALVASPRAAARPGCALCLGLLLRGAHPGDGLHRREFHEILAGGGPLPASRPDRGHDPGGGRLGGMATAPAGFAALGHRGDRRRTPGLPDLAAMPDLPRHGDFL